MGKHSPTVDNIYWVQSHTDYSMGVHGSKCGAFSCWNKRFH